jgi:phage terminase small subunit
MVEGALHNDSDSVREIQQEKAIHRRFVDLQLQGYTPTEIAKQTGYSMQWVSQVLKQPFARQHFINESKKTVQEEMKDFLESEVLPSLQALKSVRDDPEARKADKIVASNSLLDRFLGKPVQPIAADAKPPSEMSDEQLRQQIERELTTSQSN